MVARILLAVLICMAAGRAAGQQALVIEDFEAYRSGGLPISWRMPDRRSNRLLPLPLDHAQPGDYVKVVKEDSGQVLQVYTVGASVQIALPTQSDQVNWDLTTHPRLSWRWKAVALPEGARENSSRLNDTGAAVYVAFDCNDWLRRPCIIKYVYSTALDVGTVVRYGKLRVLVVSTGVEDTGVWHTLDRNIVEDYKSLFGRSVPGNPMFIMLWGDSDTTMGESETYFDDLTITPQDSQ